MSNAQILRLIVTRTNSLISASNQNISRRRDAIDATASLCDCVCSMAWMFWRFCTSSIKAGPISTS